MLNTRQFAATILFTAALGLVVIVVQREFTSPPPAVNETSGRLPNEVLEDPYPRRDRTSYHGHSLDISVFPFRDRNRNGRYDIGDLPMAGVAVVLERPDASQRLKYSNGNGYTNFTMYDGEGNADINQADTWYTFVVQAPPGWHITTGNERQRSRFLRLSGSPSGLVGESPPDVVGLAPDLTLGGRLAAIAPNTRYLLAGPRGQELEVTPGAQGEFSLPVVPGSWQLLANRDGVTTSLHTVTVGQTPVVLSAVAEIQRARRPPLSETVLQHFDQLSRSVIDKLSMGDHRLRWNYLLATDNQVYRSPGFVNVLMSGHAVGYNSSGHPVTVASAVPGSNFDFVGAFFATAWEEAEGDILEIRAWRGSKLVAEDSLQLSYLGPSWFQADYRGIDRLELMSRHYWQFTTEDMEFRLPPASDSPLPRSLDAGDAILQHEVFMPGEVSNDSICGPVAMANAIGSGAASLGAGARKELALVLSGTEFMATWAQTGTNPPGVIRGLERYAARLGGLDALAYVGGAPMPWQLKMGYRVDAKWLQQALANDTSVVLNLGWYAPREDDRNTLIRVGGHWVTLLGVSEDRVLNLHDPGQSTASAAKQAPVMEQVVGLLAVEGAEQEFRLSDTGRPLLRNYPLPEGASMAAVDGALAWRFRMTQGSDAAQPLPR